MKKTKLRELLKKREEKNKGEKKSNGVRSNIVNTRRRTRKRA